MVFARIASSVSRRMRIDPVARAIRRGDRFVRDVDHPRAALLVDVRQITHESSADRSRRSAAVMSAGLTLFGIERLRLLDGRDRATRAECCVLVALATAVRARCREQRSELVECIRELASRARDEPCAIAVANRLRPIAGQRGREQTLGALDCCRRARRSRSARQARRSRA